MGCSLKWTDELEPPIFSCRSIEMNSRLIFQSQGSVELLGLNPKGTKFVGLERDVVRLPCSEPGKPNNGESMGTICVYI